MTKTQNIRRLWTADNLPILRCLDAESVDLIYLDPPFNSGKQWENPIGEGSKKALASFKDTWELSDMHADEEYALSLAYPKAAAVISALGEVNGEGWKAYLIYMGARLAEARRILKPTGSIYYHCDPLMSHGVKLLMDAIFGGENYRNEIIWHYRRMPAKQKQLQKMHDVILFYSKNKKKHYFEAPFGELTPASERTIERARIKGYNVNLKKRMATVFDWDKYNAAVKSGELPPNLSAKESEDAGPLMNACWTDIPILAPTAKERTGYPTQKPLALLERIIKMSSQKGEIVLDPFCGCATTCLAAERLERQWIGIDLAKEASALVVKRLKKDGEGKLEFAAYEVEHLTKLPKRTDLQGLRSDDAILKPRLYKMQNGECLGCENKTRIELMDFDHIIAESRGGQDVDENLQLLCGNCNSIKGDRGMHYLWRRILERRTEETMQKYEEKRRARAKERKQ